MADASHAENESPAPSPRRRTPGLVALTVAVIVAAVYLPALRLGYVDFDDQAYILENPHLQKPAPALVRWAFGTGFWAGNYHPLTWLSHALDLRLFGIAPPAGAHAVNVLLHAANSALVVWLAALLLGAGGTAAAGPRAAAPPLLRGGALWLGAALAGLLFGLHPQRVESVAWISERKDVLGGFFFLLAVTAHLVQARRREAGARWAGVHAAGVLAGLCALLAKPMAVTLPVVLLLLDAYPLRRFGGGPAKVRAARAGRLLLEKLPFILLAAAAAGITLLAQQDSMPTFAQYPWPPRVMTALRACVFYLVKFVWPAGLSPFYPLDPTIWWTNGDVVLSMLTLLLLAIGTAARLRRTPGLAAAFTAYLILLLPVIGLVKVGAHAAADRYMYLPGLPLVLLVAAGTGLAWQAAAAKPRATHRRAGLAAAAGLMLAALGTVTVRQIAVWENPYTLWDAAFARTRRNPLATFQRAVHLRDRGRLREARALLELLLNWHGPARPGFPASSVLSELAVTAIEEGDLARAGRLVGLAETNLVSSLPSHIVEVRMAEGRLALAEGRYDAAERAFARATGSGYGFKTTLDSEAHRWRAAALAQLDRTDEALAELERALNMDYLGSGAYRARRVEHLRADPHLARLNTDARFAALLRRHGVTPPGPPAG